MNREFHAELAGDTEKIKWQKGLEGRCARKSIHPAGDWVENCTAFVEYEDGNFELLRYFELASCLEAGGDQRQESELFSPAAMPPNLVARHAAEWESEHVVRR